LREYAPKIKLYIAVFFCTLPDISIHKSFKA